jgi:DNA-binding IclR family transcriptional regulator
MNPKTEIRESEWLRLIDEFKPKRPPNSMTVKELCALWKCSQTQAHRYLQKAMSEGLATRHRIVFANYYTLTKPDKKPS